jgi:hypothetical protein
MAHVPSSLANAETVIRRAILDDRDGYGDVELLLVDTPGFDNASKPDILVLGDLLKLVRETTADGVSLSGILYLHRITDIRMGGSAAKNLQLLRELCGKTFLSRLTLVTTMWDLVRESVGARRERDLMANFWKDLIDNGAHHRRYDGTKSGEHGALQVIEMYLSDTSQQTETASIQQQAAWPLRETDAGRFQLRNLHQKVNQYTSRLEEKKQEHAVMGYDEQLQWDRAVIDGEISQLERELGHLKALLARYSHDGDASNQTDVEGSWTEPGSSGPRSPSLPTELYPQTAPWDVDRDANLNPTKARDDSEASYKGEVDFDAAMAGSNLRRPKSSMASLSRGRHHHSQQERRHPKSSLFEPVDEITLDGGASLAEDLDGLNWDDAEGSNITQEQSQRKRLQKKSKNKKVLFGKSGNYDQTVEVQLSLDAPETYGDFPEARLTSEQTWDRPSWQSP